MAVGTDDGVRQVRRTHDRPCDDAPGDHLGCRTHVRLVQWQVFLTVPPKMLKYSQA